MITCSCATCRRSSLMLCIMGSVCHDMDPMELLSWHLSTLLCFFRALTSKQMVWRCGMASFPQRCCSEIH